MLSAIFIGKVYADLMMKSIFSNYQNAPTFFNLAVNFPKTIVDNIDPSAGYFNDLTSSTKFPFV